MNVRLIPANEQAVGDMCRRGLRPCDVREMSRCGHIDPYMALHLSVCASDVAIAAYTDRGIACVIGVAKPSLLADGGVIWLMAHRDIERYSVRFLKECQRILDVLLAHYGRLENHIDVENARTIAWLEWLGFTIDKSCPVNSPTGFPFYHFWKEATNV